MLYDVAVIGCGAMGSASLSFLARRGAKVIGIEQFKRNHERGSTHAYTRLFRDATAVYKINKGYEAMM